jgi:hypothetical protein
MAPCEFKDNNQQEEAMTGVAEAVPETLMGVTTLEARESEMRNREEAAAWRERKAAGPPSLMTATVKRCLRQKNNKKARDAFVC